jgi:hypothetical protein
MGYYREGGAAGKDSAYLNGENRPRQTIFFGLLGECYGWIPGALEYGDSLIIQ